MSLDALAKRNIALDVNCCLKTVLVEAGVISGLKYDIKLVPALSPPDGFLANDGQWKIILKKTISCLEEKGHNINDGDISEAKAEALRTKQLAATTLLLRTIIRNQHGG